ncbi:MAG: CDP-diacylglycerol--glycerol-3-phosphate 3-phosphatidyltransferase [Actinobacteria bacterium]|nr:MAG: CDP-diacylglycerol--glycerol-3-phosphate 3-phosphatidyltransferase [Actinomycetota bacterium]
MKAVGTGTYGPSALATPANAVTVARLLATPLLVALVLVLGASWVTVTVWAVLAGTDGLDGWVARRQGATRSGAFLDPLADKVLVVGALVALVARGEIWWLPVALIGGRELGISGYRVVVGRRGVSVPARWTGKAKAWAQDLAVGLALLPPVATHHHGLVVAVLWTAVGLTFVSGTQYVVDRRGAGQSVATLGASSAVAGLGAQPKGAR